MAIRMKKILCGLFVAGLFAASLQGCSFITPDLTEEDRVPENTEKIEVSEKDNSEIKIGVVYSGDEGEGNTAAHMQGIDAMIDVLDLSGEQVIEKTNVRGEGECYGIAVELIEQGCDIIFAADAMLEEDILQAAIEYPEVQFCNAGGFWASSAGLSNLHNYNIAFHEPRYVSGIAAGLKLNEMLEAGEITAEEAKIGYVGTYSNAEVISGFTAFYLGAKSVCPAVMMEVGYTNSVTDLETEKEMAAKLIGNGCVLLGQHISLAGVIDVCDERGIFYVGADTDAQVPDSDGIKELPETDMLLADVNVDWSPYYIYAAESVMNDRIIDTDWCQGYAQGTVSVTVFGEENQTGQILENLSKTEEALKNGTIHVFDIDTFTINGSSLEELIAQGGDYNKYSIYVYDGYFHESEFGSAPVFDLIIDGITVSNPST